MAQIDSQISTGLPGLDEVFRGMIPGDNIVWQVDSVEDYVPFVEPYCRGALARGRRPVYFRFAKHAPLVPDELGAEIHCLHPERGFEAFLAEVHRVIEQNPRGGYYFFDCLSELAVDWYSDQMLANFFMLTCPYLFDVEAIAYFALLRNYHSLHAIGPVSETTQVFVDVHRRQDKLYIHPLKVQQRYSPTMYMLHVRDGDRFLPVTQSATTAEILTAADSPGLPSADLRPGVWKRTFLEAEEVVGAVRQGRAPPEKADEYFDRLGRMMVSRDERVFALVRQYLSLEDLLRISRRMIGTGLIGGKSVGMLLARAILARDDSRWAGLLEAHDSFFVGSDVFYTFLVRNGVWWTRQKQRDQADFLDGAERARQTILRGSFPDYVQRQLADMLDYFGQSPIIVRSSSLLEDNFGNAFAGKYESVFCANQGPRDKRLEDFLSAVRTIYASTMSEKALTYRAQRGLLDSDEQMALLVQRVSGGMHGRLFYPHVAGVGFSLNPYVWNERIDPNAGMLRLVFGLGTRAVNRSDDDYTRVVALNAPELRPEANFDEVRQYAQRRVDVIDLQSNQLISSRFPQVAGESADVPIELFVSAERHAESDAAGQAHRVLPPVLTFQRLLTETGYVGDMGRMLRVLQAAYDYPVDVEFTTNFFPDGYKIDLVQCRPLQVNVSGTVAALPKDIDPDKLVLQAHGAVIGTSRLETIDRLIYVVPAAYGQLPIRDRYAVARVIGRVVHAPGPGRRGRIMLLGPGRWGTTTPSLGVPVAFSDISAVSVLCEIVAMREDFVPDVSLGTHFFSDLVELDILYLALFPAKEKNFINDRFFDEAPNKLAELAPDADKWSETVQVVDVCDLPDGGELRLYANTVSQTVVCYLERSCQP